MAHPYIPLIDADSICYASSGACKDDDPVEFALYNAKKAMEAIIDEFDRGLEYKAYLTGTGNFRDAIAVTQPYKGNRTAPKPPYLQDVREYLREVWRAEVVDGMEADDKVAIDHVASGGTTCIVSIDKDLNQVEGPHFNYRKKEFYEVSHIEGIRFFYLQMLTGDRVDNIKGIPGIGPAKAEKILAKHKDERGWYSAVLEKYRKAYTDGMKVLTEHANLLYIRRKEGDIWTPPLV